MEEKALSVENVKVKLTEEETDLISRGIRPEGMDRDRFKALRSYSRRMDKEYSKGHFLYISKETVEQADELTGKREKVVKTYPVYKRSQPKILGKAGKA